jgi:hypothetical protein
MNYRVRPSPTGSGIPTAAFPATGPGVWFKIQSMANDYRGQRLRCPAKRREQIAWRQMFYLSECDCRRTINLHIHYCLHFCLRTGHQLLVAVGQYSSASMMVITRSVTDWSAASDEW